jgi:hypothetical protein
MNSLINFGKNGHISDGGVIACTDFYKKLESKYLNTRIPQTEHNSNAKNLLYVFIGDEIFALREDLL